MQSDNNTIPKLLSTVNMLFAVSDTVDKNGYLTSLGGQSVLSNRYAYLLLYFRQIAK